MSLSPRFNLLSVRWLYHEIIIAFYNPESGGKKRRGPRLCVVWLFFRLTAPLRYASTFIYLLFRSVIGRSGQQGAVWTHRTICPTLHNRHLIAYPIYSMLRCIKHIVGYTFRTLFVVFFLYEGSTVYKSFLLSVTNYFEIKESAAVHFAASPLDGDILQTEKVWQKVQNFTVASVFLLLLLIIPKWDSIKCNNL